jgi:hypothetical protein
MSFSYQTRGSIAQALSVVSDAATRDFLYKHLGLQGSKMPPVRGLLADAPVAAIQSMLVELLENNLILRSAAPDKDAFDIGVENIRRWVLLDGWNVEGGTLVRETPMAEDVTGIRDRLVQDLAACDLDNDNAIRLVLEGSSKDFVAQPPDVNGSITKARIALETVARRAAKQIATTRAVNAPEDKWGKAIEFLRAQGVIEQPEEEILTRVYTFVSPAAHIPAGVTGEEWARLARTFAVSSAYFLLRKYMAA